MLGRYCTFRFSFSWLCSVDAGRFLGYRLMGTWSYVVVKA